MIWAVDLGTNKIKILGVKKQKEETEAVFKTERNSEGIRRGVIVEEEKVIQILKSALEEGTQQTKEKPEEIIVSLNGSHIFSLEGKGTVSVSRADQRISEEDTKRAIQAAQIIEVPPNREIFEVFLKEFVINNELRVKDACNLTGTKLEAEILMLGGFSPYLEKVKKTVNKAGYELLDMICAPLAAARAVLNQREKELACAVLDIGAGTSGLAVFEEENLIDLLILPVGSLNVTNDIAIAFKIDTDLAERIKLEYGSCFFKGKDSRIKIQISESEHFSFSRKTLVKIISARVGEIFNQILQELKKLKKERELAGGIILTGGGAKLQNIVEFAKEKFRLPVRIGKPREILGLDPDPAWAVVAGLALFGLDVQKEEKIKVSIFSKIKKFFKIFLP